MSRYKRLLAWSTFWSASLKHIGSHYCFFHVHYRRYWWICWRLKFWIVWPSFSTVSMSSGSLSWKFPKLPLVTKKGYWFREIKQSQWIWQLYACGRSSINHNLQVYACVSCSSDPHMYLSGCVQPCIAFYRPGGTFSQQSLPLESCSSYFIYWLPVLDLSTYQNINLVFEFLCTPTFITVLVFS